MVLSHGSITHPQKYIFKHAVNIATLFEKQIVLLNSLLK